MDAKAEAAVESVREGCVCDASLASPWRGNVSGGVLTRHWVLTHPELAATLPAVTRMEERQRERDSRDATERRPRTTLRTLAARLRTRQWMAMLWICLS